MEVVSDKIDLLEYKFITRFVSVLIDLSPSVAVLRSVSALIRLLLSPTLSSISLCSSLFLCFLFSLFALLLQVKVLKTVLTERLVRLVGAQVARLVNHWFVVSVRLLTFSTSHVTPFADVPGKRWLASVNDVDLPRKPLSQVRPTKLSHSYRAMSLAPANVQNHKRPAVWIPRQPLTKLVCVVLLFLVV